MRASILFLGAAALVSAQSTNTSACCSVDPGSVDSNTRLAWCRAQQNSCPELCTNGQTSANTCDNDKLTFSCTCQSGAAPNISDFSQTLPSLECDEWKRQCIASHPNDLAGQNFCLSYNCGTKNASAVGAGAGSTGGSSGGSSSGSGSSGSPSSSTSSSPSATSSTSAANVIAVGRQCGTGALLLALTALFTFAL